MAALDLPVRRHHRADEEPDVDERPLDEWWEAEMAHCADHCGRCGHRGHADAKCPTIQPFLLREQT